MHTAVKTFYGAEGLLTGKTVSHDYDDVILPDHGE